MRSPGYTYPAWPMVSTLGPWGLTVARVGTSSAPTSGAWESANRAVYLPIRIPTTCIAKRVWWANGSTTTGGATVECGLYRDAGYKPGAKLISGSATQGTASQIQFVDVTDTTLTPGLLWVALVMSSATNTTAMRVSPTGGGAFDAAMKFQEASASPLPSTATPVEAAASQMPYFGFSTTTIT